MTGRTRGFVRNGRPWLVTLLWLPCLGIGSGQAQEQAAAAIIADLTYQSDLRPSGGFFTCGSMYAEMLENRRLAESLVKLGDSALPDIERVLDSVEQEGLRSQFGPFAGWVVFAYAKITGAAAYPRLRTMMGNPKLEFLQHALANCVSVALGLTSYVDSSSLLPDIMCRNQEPRDALNQVILAWERSDRPRLQSNLGPDAKTALKLLLKKKSWAALRAELTHGKPDGIVAVGYRFSGSGRWFEPEGTVEEDTAKPNLGGSPGQFGIDTLFKDSSGGTCGTLRVKFKEIPVKGTYSVKYVVDNSDFGDLLRLIAFCAAEAHKIP